MIDVEDDRFEAMVTEALDGLAPTISAAGTGACASSVGEDASNPSPGTSVLPVGRTRQLSAPAEERHGE